MYFLICFVFSSVSPVLVNRQRGTQSGGYLGRLLVGISVIFPKEKRQNHNAIAPVSHSCCFLICCAAVHSPLSLQKGGKDDIVHDKDFSGGLVYFPWSLFSCLLCLSSFWKQSQLMLICFFYIIEASIRSKRPRLE